MCGDNSAKAHDHSLKSKDIPVFFLNNLILAKFHAFCLVQLVSEPLNISILQL